MVSNQDQNFKSRIQRFFFLFFVLSAKPATLNLFWEPLFFMKNEQMSHKMNEFQIVNKRKIFSLIQYLRIRSQDHVEPTKLKFISENPSIRDIHVIEMFHTLSQKTKKVFRIRSFLISNFFDLMISPKNQN